MEALYAKLYNKYDTLKKKKISEMDGINKDQEVKFLNYVSVAEELIQHLKEENDQLRARVNDLRNEISSIRSTNDEQCAEYQKMLAEENQKNRKLQEGFLSSSGGKKNHNERLDVIKTAQVTSEEMSVGSKGMTRKRSREIAEMGTGITTGLIYQYNASVRELPAISSMGTLSSGDLTNDQQLESCKNTVDGTVVDDAKNTVSTNFQFQALIETMIGMKLSTVNQSGELCISALHQSSGYSFSLTWVKKGDGEEPELVYRVLTLGTFERIAPEWMRSVLMFSMSMCPIFFERVARVIKLYS